jgi:hypothetical protein
MRGSTVWLVAGAALALPGLASAQGYTVAVLGAANDPAAHENVRDSIMCAGRGLGAASAAPRTAYEIARVDVVDVASDTPDANDLLAYDAVLVYNEVAFADPVGLGDVVAFLVENGRGVVVAGSAFADGMALEGRFVTQGLSPFTGTGPAASPGGNLGIEVSGNANVWASGPTVGHISVYGLAAFDGGAASYLVTGLQAKPQAEITARWTTTTSDPAVVLLDSPIDGQGRVAALNLFPPNDLADPSSWAAGTDGGMLLGGALNWVLGFERQVVCENRLVYQDLNCNGIDVFDEPLIDNSSAECQAVVDPFTGFPYDNNDYYFNWYDYECQYPTDGFDADRDLLSAGAIPLFQPDSDDPWQTFLLQCDKCPEVFDPNQYDWDCELQTPDLVGDLCDSCPYVDNDMAQTNADGDCFGDVCDNCILRPNADQYDRDGDGDGDACDNCPDLVNPSQYGPGTETQLDFDADAVGDPCDNCPELFNTDQLDSDGDGLGDVCDNCPFDPNPLQADDDGDFIGNVCDNCPDVETADITDRDFDGLGDLCDNCPLVVNRDQLDVDLDGFGDACDICPQFGNPDQSDVDGDQFGDVCDNCPEDASATQDDADGDGHGDACDNCPEADNANQDDSDGDGFGNVCDHCDFVPSETNDDVDGDGLGDLCDNCPTVPNQDQADDDNDGQGNSCDTRALRGGGEVKPPSQGCDASGAAAGWLLGLLGLLAVAGRRRVP